MSYDDVRWLKMQNQGNLAQAKFREDKKDFSRSIQNHQNKNLENHNNHTKKVVMKNPENLENL